MILNYEKMVFDRNNKPVVLRPDTRIAITKKNNKNLRLFIYIRNIYRRDYNKEVIVEYSKIFIHTAPSISEATVAYDANRISLDELRQLASTMDITRLPG